LDNKFLTTGVSDKFQLFPREMMLGIQNSLTEKINNLNLLLNSSSEKRRIDEAVKAIWFDEEILKFNQDKYFKEFYIPIISKITGKDNLTKFTDATFFIRVNLPKIKDFYSEWHQDAGTFLYSNSIAYKYKSYTLWSCITEGLIDNSIEFLSKENYVEKVYNSEFKKSKRHGKITFHQSMIPFDENKIKKINLNFKPGEAIVFDSLVFHRTVRKSNKIRISFDLRLFSKKDEELITKRSLISRLKRFVFDLSGVKLY